MAYCSKCGKPLAEDAAFCSSCGARVSSEPVQRKESYEGSVQKCPSCGQVLDAFSAVCPSCGYELRGVEGLSRVNDLADKLESASTIEEKNDLIKNFYIPNTREDIYEFFILATSNIEAGGDSTDAWYAKLDQAYKKAELVFGDGPELKRLSSLYSKTSKTRNIKSLFSMLVHSRGLQCAILFSIGLVMELIGNFLGSASGDSNSPFYMLALLGIYPILGALLLFILSLSNKKQN